MGIKKYSGRPFLASRSEIVDVDIDATLGEIYRDDKRIQDYKFGFKYAMTCAAEFINSWDGQKSPYRLGDLLLCKFNQLSKSKLRKSRKKSVVIKKPRYYHWAIIWSADSIQVGCMQAKDKAQAVSQLADGDEYTHHVKRTPKKDCVCSED